MEVRRAVCPRPIEESFDSAVAYFCAAHMSTETVHRLSIAALLLHLSFRHVAHYLLVLPDPALLCRLLWVLATVWVVSSLWVLCMKCWHHYSLIIMGMVTLFLVEAMMPLTLLASGVLWSVGVMGVWDVVMVCGSVVAVGTTSARCIREALYPSLGHG